MSAPLPQTTAVDNLEANFVPQNAEQRNTLANVKAKFVPTTAPPLPKTVGSATLTPAPSVSITPPQPATQAAGLQGYLASSADAFTKAQADDAETAKQGEQNSFDLLMKSLGNTEGQVQLTNDAYGKTVDPAKAELNDINNKIVAEQVSARHQIEALQRANPNGLGAEAIQQKIDDINRASISKQADLAVIQMAKQGKYDSAKEIADRAVSAIIEKEKAKNDALQLNYERNKDLFTTAEQRSFETAQADRNRKLDDAEYKERARYDQLIKQSDPLYQAQLATAQASLGKTLNGKPQTATQAQVQGYADRTNQADVILSKFSEQFASGSVGNLIGSANPFNPFKSSDRQQYEQAQRDFINSVLRRESGAAISASEYDSYGKQYFPQPGDGAAVVAQKTANRQTTINNLYQQANISRSALPGQIIEGDDGKRYQVGDDGETLKPL